MNRIRLSKIIYYITLYITPIILLFLFDLLTSSQLLSKEVIISVLAYLAIVFLITYALFSMLGNKAIAVPFIIYFVFTIFTTMISNGEGLMMIVIIFCPSSFCYSLGFVIYGSFINTNTETNSKLDPASEPISAIQLKTDSANTNTDDKKQNLLLILFLSLTAAILMFVIFLAPEQRSDENIISIYKTTPFLSMTLNDYFPSTNVQAYNEHNAFEFDSIIIPLPFNITDKEVFIRDGVCLYYEKNEPLIAIFDGRIRSYQLPEIKVTNSYFSSAKYQYSYYREVNLTYTKIAEYLNTVPMVNNKGEPNRDDMSSSAIYYKRLLDMKYTPSSNDLKIMNVIFDDPQINGLLYQSSYFQFVEVFKDDILFFTIYIFSPEQHEDYLDYILTYINFL